MKKSIQFKDYAPVIFERIRIKYNISNEMYQRSIGPETLLGSLVMGNLSNLTEQCSRGKSNSFFYYTKDNKFMLKTISKKEFYFFRKILKSYFNHIINNYNTLITRVFGLHKMMLYRTQKSSK